MSEISCQEGSWREPSSWGALHYRVWRPAAIRRLLVVIHGFGEHGGRYEAFGRALAGQGICVAVPDLWGHGRSGGRRGDIISVSRCVDDCRKLAEAVFMPLAVQRQYALFGHSFGGLAAIQWALEAPAALRRLIIQSPLIEVGFPLPWWKVFAARLLARFGPACSFKMNLEVSALSHNPEVVNAYRTDPLVHSAMSARSYTAILAARDDALQRAHALRTPVLMLCGAEDRIISLEASQRWFDRLVCEKRQVVFPGSYHELHHEAVSGEVLPLIGEWVLADA